MKKKLGVILSALLLSMSCFAASDPELDSDINVDGLFNTSPTVAVKSFDTAEISPATNVLTGTKDAYTFDADDLGDYFYNGDYGTASQYIYTTATDEAKGKVFAVVLDTDEYNKHNSSNDAYVYSSLVADFTKTLDRPIHLYFETYGTKQIGFWLNAGSTHKGFGQLGNSAWHSVSMDNVSVFNGSMNRIWLQYATRPSDCSEAQYYDNLAVFPFYKITYNSEYPDGTSGNDTVKYFFDASELSVADDGTVSGLPQSYTVEAVAAETLGYELIGWSTEKNSDTAMTEVTLNGEDIELYPVWKEADKLKVPDENFIPGINVFTGNTTALNFNASSHIKFFENVQETDLFSYAIADDPTSSGKGKMLSITMDTEKFLSKYDSGTYTYHTIMAEFESAIKRPGVLLYDTYGRGTVGFWLSAGTSFMGLGTLPGSSSWMHVAQNNSAIFNGNMSALYIQYGINDTNCDNVQYFDNIAFIPFYKATYVIKYPDGTTAEPTEKYFLTSNGAITASNDGTLRGIPKVFTPEDLGLSFPGYDLAGWTTDENGATAMANIPLENKDITVYPVWEKKAEAIPVTLTVYLDTEKKVSETYNLFVGDSFTLPTYYDLTEYTPDGKIPQGSMIDGKLYAPGKTFYIPENSEISAEAKYGEPDYPEYGKLVFLENFESLKNGTYIINADSGAITDTPISYINPKWSTNRSHFEISRADTLNHLYVADDGTGNHVLKLQKANAGQTWPQFGIYNNADTPEGNYTFVADICVPSSQAGRISNFNIRMYHTNSDFLGNSINTPASDAGTWKTLTIEMPVKAGSVYEALLKFQIYLSTSTSYADSYCYIDNMALYVKDDALNIKLSDSQTTKVFFVPGESIAMPYAYEVYESTPDGYMLAGFSNGSLTLKPGESYTTKASDSGTVFEAVYEKIQYSLSFDLGSGYGTVSEIPVMDGDIVTLPQSGAYHPQAKLIGWKVYGNDKVYAPGDSFTFVREKEKANFDGTDRLVFAAVYDKNVTSNVKFTYNYKLNDGLFSDATADELAYIKLAYGAGIIPASDSFDAEKKVTLSELAKIGERLHYRSQGIASDFLTEKDRLSDLASKGICGKYESLGANATFADAAVVLANALPHSCYSEIAFDVTVNGLDVGDDGYAEALKLIRAGILPESTDFTAEITYADLVSAIAKTVQPSVREAENKRTFYVLGDSLTAKTGTIGWPTKLEPFLDGNLEIVNNGIGGINTGTYFSKYDPNGAYALYNNSLKSMKKGDYVVIALGTNDSTLWGWGDMKYEASRDNYYRYIREIRAQGGIPILVCPVGRNTLDENGVYVESDPLIIECMNDVNELYGVSAPIINFKNVSVERLGAMTVEERLNFYAPGDGVHYSHSGAEIVAGWFDELVTSSSDVKLSGLKPHFNEISFDFESEENLYSFDVPETEKVTSVRTESPSGIRFRASIDEAARNISDDAVEYGFIVARSDALGEKALTHDTDVTYVTGISYNNVSRTDIIYDVNDENGDITFTGVLINIPDNKDGYMTRLTVRSYVKVGCSYFYGETHEDSIYEAAKRLGDTDSEYVKNIIRVCES